MHHATRLVRMSEVHVLKLILDLAGHRNRFSGNLAYRDPQSLCRVSTGTKHDNSIVTQEEGLRAWLSDTLASYASMLAGDLVSIGGRSCRNIVNQVYGVAKKNNQLVFLVGYESDKKIRASLV